MAAASDDDARMARAVELANLGIAAQADGDCQAARHAWQDALTYAEHNLPGDKIVSWIRSGLGDALLKSGDYEAAIEMAGSACAFCALVRAPLALLTMAEASLRLGRVADAREYAGQACAMRGQHVLETFSSADRRALDPTAH